jgi:ABC-2 type transport system permease protein
MTPYALVDSWTMTRRELAHWARRPVQALVALSSPS